MTKDLDEDFHREAGNQGTLILPLAKPANECLGIDELSIQQRLPSLSSFGCPGIVILNSDILA
jgi:hypothetical protein